MKIVDIANTYLDEHGELPLLIVAKKDDEERVIRCHIREKHAQADQATFIKVMRLAMIVYGYTSYEFIVKPEFNYQALQMTKNVWAVGHVTPQEQKSEFFVIEDEKLVPYFDEMPIGGFIAQMLPSEGERQIELKPAVVKQIKLYIENCTYAVPQKTEKAEVVEDGFAVLAATYR